MSIFRIILGVLLTFSIVPTFAIAQTHSAETPLVAFCDPLMLLNDDTDEEDGDEEDLTETRRYDLERSERLTTREQIMNALFEEKWNFETNEPIARNELCSAEPNYVVLWTKLLRDSDEVGFETDAEGYMAIQKGGTFELVFAKRPYTGSWELDGTEMVLSANWLNNGKPYRSNVDLVETPVDTVDSEGKENSFSETMYRIGSFRFYRLPTTMKGGQRICSCTNSGG